MVRVGINSPVTLSKAEINSESGNLQISFREGKVKSLLEQFSDNSTADASDTVITVWPVKLEDNDQEKKEPQIVADELNTVKKQLIHILQAYVPTDKIKFDSLEGLEVETEADLLAKLRSEDGIKKMYDNLAKQFVEQFNALPETQRKQTVRLLLVRQSKAKHFPTFRKKFLDTNPFIEPSSIPEDASQLKFTKYEIKNGYDKGEEAAAEDLADQAPADNDNVDIDSVLGGR